MSLQSLFADSDSVAITIDGPSGAGKSTLARLLAQRLGMLYMDTGSMYRAAAYFRINRHLPAHDEEALYEALQKADLVIKQGEEGTAVYLDGQDISQQIRTPEMSREASRISTWSSVRRLLVGWQREMCRQGKFVIEGRDTGSVVFPDTPYKFFLDASLKQRAQRREEQLVEQKMPQQFREIVDDMAARDRQDTSRHDSPLVVPEGARIIDSTELSIEGVLAVMIEHIKNIKQHLRAGLT